MDHTLLSAPLPLSKIEAAKNSTRPSGVQPPGECQIFFYAGKVKIPFNMEIDNSDVVSEKDVLRNFTGGKRA